MNLKKNIHVLASGLNILLFSSTGKMGHRYKTLQSIHIILLELKQ